MEYILVIVAYTALTDEIVSPVTVTNVRQLSGRSTRLPRSRTVLNIVPSLYQFKVCD